jgi:hypothetical protein
MAGPLLQLLHSGRSGELDEPVAAEPAARRA